jgi:four helix bundle protein
MSTKPRQDLKARAFAFAARILELYPRLRAGGPAYEHMASQLLESASSIGAQLEEGEVANSRRDMAAKYAIALRESREANFWLRLYATIPAWCDALSPLIQESREFVAMLTVSVRKLRNPPDDPQACPLPFALCPLPFALCPLPLCPLPWSLASLLTMILVGTSGWHYPAGRGTWNGVFYPLRRPAKFDELAYYAEHFDTVEINATFYRMPEPAMSQAWLRRTPPGFVFSVKLYQKFTHPDMFLARASGGEWDVSGADVELFRRGIDPIAGAGRLGAVLVQFPPSFHADPEARDYLDWLLTSLSGYPLAVELRHQSWIEDAAATTAHLAARGATWARTDAPTKDLGGHLSESASGKTTSEVFYVRLHGRNAAAWWIHEESEDRYDYLYAAAELEPFAREARAASAAGRRVLLYLNNHFSAKAVANAAVLKHQLGQPVPGDYPAAMIDRYPDLEGIVTRSGLPL